MKVGHVAHQVKNGSIIAHLARRFMYERNLGGDVMKHHIWDYDAFVTCSDWYVAYCQDDGAVRFDPIIGFATKRNWKCAEEECSGVSCHLASEHSAVYTEIVAMGFDDEGDIQEVETNSGFWTRSDIEKGMRGYVWRDGRIVFRDYVGSRVWKLPQ